MEYIIFAIVVLIAVRVGWKLNEMWWLYMFTEHPERVQEALKLAERIKAEDADEEVTAKLKVTELEIERVGNMIYAYDKQTHQFLAQGTSIKEMLDAYHKRYPTRKVLDLKPQDAQNS